jgi:hypothetical protein
MLLTIFPISMIRAGALTLAATPARALFVSRVLIRVRTDRPNETVTLEASTTIDGVPYHSWALFRSNRSGILDLSRDAPLSGSYREADSMGLFWSMSPEGLAQAQSATLSPIVVQLRALTTGESAAVRLWRLRVSPDVVRQSVSATVSWDALP